MTIKFANNISTTLALGAGIAATSFDVASTTGFPVLGVGDYFYGTISNTLGAIEIVQVTSWTGTTVTCVRGAEGTPPAAWSTGDSFEIRVTAAGLTTVLNATEVVEEVQTATSGQTVFTLTTFMYVPGENTLSVYVDGVNQIVDLSYTETGTTTVTFITGLHLGALVKFTTLRTSGLTTSAAVVTYEPAGTGAVATTVQAKLRQPGIDVRDYGAVGNGVVNDLPAMKLARAQAGLLGVPLLFSPGRYGIDDIFIYSEDGCTVVVFSPGAEIVLLSNTTAGGATAAQGTNIPTEPIHIFNPTVDCQNFAGENAIGATHIIGSTFYNVTVKNTEASNTTFGGKAIQWEGGATIDSKVYGLTVENSTVGIDIGVEVGVQTTHIGIYNVSMKNVDIPISINDTTTISPSNSYDQLEIMIDGIQCRNCGKLTYTGATSTGGGIIVQDRGFRATVRNLQVINDRGGYGSTAYGGIGALVRGQGQALILENVSIDADMTALFDFNPSTFQSAYTGDIASYAYVNTVRQFGNLDYVVKCLPGGGKLGKGIYQQVEIGSTAASLAGIVEVNSAAYNDSFLELIDRDNVFASTGLLNFKDIYLRGNALTGGNAIVGRGTLAQYSSPWVPTDGSTDALTFTAASGWWFRIGDMATVMGFITYPSTAAVGDARIGSLPVPPANTDAVIGGGGISKTTTAAVGSVIPEKSSNKATVISPTGGAVLNSAMSGHTIAFTLTYPIRIDY